MAPGPRGPAGGRTLAALAVVHPLPSAINAVLVLGLAMLAGGDVATAALLGLGMLGYQVSIGALNDVVDADLDRLGKPDAPIPRGLVSTRLALGLAIAGGSLGSLVSTGFGIPVLAAGSAGYACGLAYDLVMRWSRWAWTCFSAALPLLLAWTWLAVAGSLPPGWPLLLPMAALAGPALHLANGIVDLEADERVGRTSLASRLGIERARRTLAVLTALIYAVGGLALAVLAGAGATLAALGAALPAAVGVALSWQDGARARELGWLAQAVGLALLALVWTSSVPA
jgi:geranylgeranylglycerol-phosphate geranylgeranyltransferase